MFRLGVLRGPGALGASALGRLRTERRLTQEGAPQAVRLSAKHLRRIELGEANVTLATLVAFSVAYELPLAGLVA